MSYEKSSPSSRKSSQPTRPNTLSGSDMLTKSELERLRRVGQEQSDEARKAFAHLRPKPARGRVGPEQS
jgi:hypothetical protein